jgi:hypothetical protein
LILVLGGVIVFEMVRQWCGLLVRGAAKAADELQVREPA